MKVEDTTITSVVQASQDEAIQVTSPIIPIPNDVSLVARMPPMKQVVFLSNLMKDYFNDRELYVTDTIRMVESMKYHSNYLSVHAS
ncbi:hypothetical protein [Clostridium sp. 1xD42-85]|nr:hypothetical protein [Clostridium sp. 1xD42-85]